ncbi:hypothetical protein D0N36_10095 [Hymenobacter lapidiphilus]|uniref:hypothetical protein n=1 Tax=Hymenobacter sp. CCM 8763 TaxID=2303334 RepID=UPI000E356344|nr:hypothetical protein [Hymenobacter sp. CCM 8763]RFP65206.1 hypothetical protein D0N36_10095 [Hymenobacter sp. CCM 8763]
MSDDEFLPYQRFPNATVAQPLLELLYAHDIEAQTRFDQPSFDISFAFNETNRYFQVLLRPADFARAQALEQQAAEALTADLPADYYLFAFSSAELHDIMLRPDEWNLLDVALARRLLAERGEALSPARLEELRQQRLDDLARPESRQTRGVLAGYALALLGGFFGLLIGWHLYSHGRQLPDGRRVPTFRPADRAHGLRIVVLSSLCMLGLLVWFFCRELL